MDPLKMPCHFTGFLRLQMTDEMPLGINPHERYFGHRVLDGIFSETSLPEFGHCLHLFECMRLRDSDERDILCFSTGTFRTAGDFPLYSLKSICLGAFA
jgi:hypothetical protein